VLGRREALWKGTLAVNQTGEKRKECPFCGEEIVAVTKKCNYCGQPFDVAVDSLASGEPESELGKLITGGVLLILVCVLFVICAAVLSNR
jgi:hypothetical protein